MCMRTFYIDFLMLLKSMHYPVIIITCTTIGCTSRAESYSTFKCVPYYRDVISMVLQLSNGILEQNTYTEMMHFLGFGLSLCIYYC